MSLRLSFGLTKWSLPRCPVCFLSLVVLLLSVVVSWSCFPVAPTVFLCCTLALSEWRCGAAIPSFVSPCLNRRLQSLMQSLMAGRGPLLVRHLIRARHAGHARPADLRYPLPLLCAQAVAGSNQNIHSGPVPIAASAIGWNARNAAGVRPLLRGSWPPTWPRSGSAFTVAGPTWVLHFPRLASGLLSAWHRSRPTRCPRRGLSISAKNSVGRTSTIRSQTRSRGKGLCHPLSAPPLPPLPARVAVVQKKRGAKSQI